MSASILLQATPPSLSTPKPNSHSSNPMHAMEISSCSTMLDIKQYHSQIVKLGLSSDNDAVGRLIKFCAVSKSGDLNYALKLFDCLPQPDAFVYNTIMRGYLLLELTEASILFFSQMLQESVSPNKFTFPPVIRACSVKKAIYEGKQVHAHALKLGFGSDGYTQNNLIHMYVNFQCLEEARRVFDRMPHPDDVSWTTMISGYAQMGHLEEARKVFDLMPERNSAAWNAMIAAYVQNNSFDEAFGLFEKMRSEGVAIDKFVAASMLSACTGLGALKQGEWIHWHIQRSGIEVDSKLATTIIDMYCKCGCLDKAFEVFSGLPRKGLSSWNCMIGGLAVHGKGETAIELFKEMEREKVMPDYITFVNVLSACAHSGLVEKGRYYFRYMTGVYGIAPGMEHFGCMVDLLGRAGMLQEAKKIMDEMPMSPDVAVMGALLGACRIHQNVELGEEIGKKAIALEPQNSGRYVILANIYASAGRWEDVAYIRKLMNDSGVKKPPGFSLIELEGVVNEFIAGGRNHPQAKEIYEKVHEMLDCIRSIGYVPDTEGLLVDDGMNEEAGEKPLYYHSEKLAMAYGLLKTKTGEVIRITKNLRVCKDCHNASKMISRLYDREIIVRDRNRFHHFKGGVCSCNDYW